MMITLNKAQAEALVRLLELMSGSSTSTVKFEGIDGVQDYLVLMDLKRRIQEDLALEIPR